MMAPKQFTSRVLSHVRGARRGRLGRLADAQAAADAISALPAYQVALWPDGWLLEADGSVRVRDTHEMAEARRWLQMAARNAAGRSRQVMADTEVARTMRLHGVFVPRAVIDMAGRRFISEQIASVALSLVAGDWISERRQTLGLSAEPALALQALAWSGSRHAGAPDADAARCLLQELLDQCIEEGLVPRARYRLGCRADDGYGIRCCLCCVQVDLDRDARARVQQVLSTALIPWNRAVIRDGRATPVLSVHVRAPADRSGFVGALRGGSLDDQEPDGQALGHQAPGHPALGNRLEQG